MLGRGRDRAGFAMAVPIEYAPMIYLDGAVGMRWSEVAGLKVRDIDFFRRRLTVRETVAEVNGRILDADVKTDASRRPLTLPTFLRDMLAEHLASRAAEWTGRVRLPSARRLEPFATRTFGQGSSIRPWRKVNLDGVTFHTLRHSAGGLMRQAGVHTQIIQQRLGHASSRTTTDIYGYVPDESERAAADSIDDLFTRAPCPKHGPQARRERRLREAAGVLTWRGGEGLEPPTSTLRT